MLFLVAWAAGTAQAQRVDPRFTYYRVYCVIPLAGTGGEGDPIRPSIIPAAGIASSQESPQQGPKILGFYHELSDDGRWALAEIVFRDHAAAQTMVREQQGTGWAIEKGSIPLAEVQAVFRQYKKSIDMRRFGVVVR